MSADVAISENMETMLLAHALIALLIAIYALALMLPLVYNVIRHTVIWLPIKHVLPARI